MDESGINTIVFNWVIVFLLLLVNAFFVGAEFAIVRARKNRIEQLNKDGNVDARLALKALEDVNFFIAAVQVGVTIASIGIGWFGSPTIEKMLDPIFKSVPPSDAYIAHIIIAIIAFILITFLHVLIGEQVPKCIALQYPEKISLFVAKPMDVFMTLSKPFVWLLNKTCNGILKILKIPVNPSLKTVHTIDDLDMYVENSYDEGVLNETEKDMFHNVLQFSDLTAHEVMTPRTDMVCVSIETPIDELNQIATENQYTRYPVYSEDIDHITGFVHVKDLFMLSLKNETCPIEKIQRKIPLVPETITLDKLVILFKKQRAQMAIVVDEFGGTSGLITLEDVLEEIFGDVQDEFDIDEEKDIKEIRPQIFEATGTMRLDELAKYFDIPEEELEVEDVDTIAGLVVKQLERIAKVGDRVEYGNFTFTVSEIDGARIIKILLVKNEPKQADEEN